MVLGASGFVKAPRDVSPNEQSIPQGLQIVVIKGQSAKVFIEIDRASEALFRLFHAARDARITGKLNEGLEPLEER
jgi:hypothetical protein